MTSNPVNTKHLYNICTTADQHCSNIIQMFCVQWEALSVFLSIRNRVISQTVYSIFTDDAELKWQNLHDQTHMIMVLHLKCSQCILLDGRRVHLAWPCQWGTRRLVPGLVEGDSGRSQTSVSRPRWKTRWRPPVSASGVVYWRNRRAIPASPTTKRRDRYD